MWEWHWLGGGSASCGGGWELPAVGVRGALGAVGLCGRSLSGSPPTLGTSLLAPALRAGRSFRSDLAPCHFLAVWPWACPPVRPSVSQIRDDGGKTVGSQCIGAHLLPTGQLLCYTLEEMLAQSWQGLEWSVCPKPTLQSVWRLRVGSRGGPLRFSLGTRYWAGSPGRSHRGDPAWERGTREQLDFLDT